MKLRLEKLLTHVSFSLPVNSREKKWERERGFLFSISSLLFLSCFVYICLITLSLSFALVQERVYTLSPSFAPTFSLSLVHMVSDKTSLPQTLRVYCAWLLLACFPSLNFWSIFSPYGDLQFLLLGISMSSRDQMHHSNWCACVWAGVSTLLGIEESEWEKERESVNKRNDDGHRVEQCKLERVSGIGEQWVEMLTRVEDDALVEKISQQRSTKAAGQRRSYCVLKRIYIIWILFRVLKRFHWNSL